MKAAGIPAAAITVRDSTEEDVDAIHRIYAGHVLNGTGSFEIDPPTVEEMARRRADYVGRGMPYLVATDGRDILGFAYAAPHRPRPAYRYTVEDSVYVAPAALGAGIGSRLLEALIRRCTERGYRQMIAVIGDSANHASIRLHEKAGFVHAGTVRSVGFKLGRWLDTVSMQRILGDGDTSDPPPEL